MTPIRALSPALTLATLVSGVAVLAPAPAAAQSPCGPYYEVRTGDSLLEIAERCGVTIPALLAANSGVVDRMDLEVGDRLRIPDPGAPQPTPVQACGVTYEVRTGDTLAEIAEKCGLTIPLLVAANGPLPDPLGVHAGLKVRIPDVPRSAVDDPGTLAAAARLMAEEAEEVEGAEEAEVEAGEEIEAAAAADATGEAEAGAAAAESPPLVQVTGTLERGPRCLLVRTAEGEATAIVGSVNDAFEPGDRVVLLGTATESGPCDHSPALELRILYRAR